MSSPYDDEEEEQEFELDEENPRKVIYSSDFSQNATKTESSSCWFDSLEQTRDSTRAPQRTRKWEKAIPRMTYCYESFKYSTLKNYFHTKQFDAAEELLRAFYSSQNNPFLAILHVVVNEPSFHEAKKNSIAYFIIRQFDKALRSGECNQSIALLDDSVKTEAFRIGLLKNCVYLDPIVSAFDLQVNAERLFKHYVDMMIEDHFYKEACLVAAALGLQHCFSVRQIVIPLIYQDRINLVEKYLHNSPQQQLETVKTLDEMCDRSFNLRREVLSTQVPFAKTQQLYKKNLCKLGAKLAKTYDIDPDLCPNILLEKQLGTIRFLFHKRYSDNSIENENWIDLIKVAVGTSRFLQRQLIEVFVEFNDLESGLKWTEYYKLSEEELPVEMRRAKQLFSSSETTVTEEIWDDAPSQDEATNPFDGTPFPLKKEQVVWADSTETMENALRRIQQMDVFGIDMEWRPEVTGKASPVSIIQVSSKSEVIIFDALRLKELPEDEIKKFFLRLFVENKTCVKLGYGLLNDFRQLLKTFPFLEELLHKAGNIVDLQTVHDKLRQIEGFFPAGHPPVPQLKGLAELTYLCFGVLLDKTEQMSDWEKRPLKQVKLLYAALDAFVLLRVHDFIEGRISEMQTAFRIGHKTGRDFLKSRARKKPFPVNPRASSGAASSLYGRGRGRGFLRSAVEEPQPAGRGRAAMLQRHTEEPPMKPAELSVVCDTMLQGLGRQLRNCGVDVRMLDSYDDHDLAVKIALEENRVILTKGSPFQKLSGYLSAGRCYAVRSAGAKEQCDEVLRHFNVKVSVEDIFSRCSTCNANNYVKVTPDEMRRCIKKLKHEVESPVAASGGHIDLETFHLNNSQVRVQVDTVPASVLDRVDTFFVCSHCGKVYWEGPHFERFQRQFAHILKVE